MNALTQAERHSGGELYSLSDRVLDEIFADMLVDDVDEDQAELAAILEGLELPADPIRITGRKRKPVVHDEDTDPDTWSRADVEPDWSALYEEFLATTEPANDNAAPLAEVVKKAPPRKAKLKRTSRARDKRNLVILPGFTPDARQALKDAGKLRKTVPIVSRVTLPYTPSHKPSTAPKTPSPSLSIDTRKAPSWNRTEITAKAYSYARAVTAHGGGLTFTIHFGGKALKALNDNAGGFGSWALKRLQRYLPAELGPRRIMFEIQQSPGTRPHLHGLIEGNMNDQQVLEDAMRAAFPGFRPQDAGDRQVDVDEINCLDGWLRYMERHRPFTQTALGIKRTVYATQDVRRQGEAIWERARAAQTRCRKSASTYSMIASLTSSTASVSAASSSPTAPRSARKATAPSNSPSISLSCASSPFMWRSLKVDICLPWVPRLCLFSIDVLLHLRDRLVGPLLHAEPPAVVERLLSARGDVSLNLRVVAPRRCLRFRIGAPLPINRHADPKALLTAVVVVPERQQVAALVHDTCRVQVLGLRHLATSEQQPERHRQR